MSPPFIVGSALALTMIRIALHSFYTGQRAQNFCVISERETIIVGVRQRSSS